MVSSAIPNLPWTEIRSGLWTRGFGRMGKLLTRAQCEELRSLYSNASLFRSRIDMERYRFGRGEYQYFANPLPALVAELREELYRFLAPTANESDVRVENPSGFPRQSGFVCQAMPSPRTEAAHPAAAALRERRLQLPASGCVR